MHKLWNRRKFLTVGGAAVAGGLLYPPTLLLTPQRKGLLSLRPLEREVSIPIRTDEMSTPTFECLIFEDNFEINKEWTIFEEIVAGNSCYGANIGEVIRTTDVVSDGVYSLRVWANKVGSDKSNHVIAQKKISDSGKTGILRYEIKTYIAPGTKDTGQTGPEYSMQNTRKQAENEFTTSTAGIQYRANPHLPASGRWAVWTEIAKGVADWQEFITQKLDAGKWYTTSLTVNYTINQYVQFTLQGDGIDISIDLSTYRIANEEKFMEKAFWLTLESENLWNNCGTAGSFNYKVYYDQIRLYSCQIFLPTV